MSKVIILGAGSSKECGGLPLGGEIWKHFDNYNTEPWYSYLSKIFSDNFPRDSRNDGKYPTFELTCSLIDYAIKSKEGLGESDEGLKSVKESLNNSYKKVFILKYIDLITELSNDEELDALNLRDNFDYWYYPFFKKTIEADKDTVFVSISYDGLIDVALWQLIDKKVIGGFTYGDKTCDLKGHNIESKNGDVLLLKPHGSINLMECPKCRKVFKYFCDLTEADPPEGYKKCCFCSEKLNTLMLTQGSHDIDKENPYYRIISEKLSEKISKATSILIIGYSLPDYDVDILHAFLKGAMGNKNRERLNVEIIDSQDPMICEEKRKNQEQEMKSKYGAIFNRSVKYHGEGFKEYASGLTGKERK